MYTYVCTCLFFYVCITHVKILKLKFVFEPKKLLQKWRLKKNIFTVKIPLIAPTLGGGGQGPPPPPVPTPMQCWSDSRVLMLEHLACWSGCTMQLHRKMISTRG